MEVKSSKQTSLMLWVAVAALLSQNLVVPVISTANFGDQKNYYTPRTPPTGSYNPPSQGSGGGHATPTPYHGTPSPGAGGGGSYGGTPPANCGNPPSGGHHRTPSPSRGGGSGSYHPPPTSTPTPTTPTTPAPVVVTPPTPIDPGTPSTPGTTIPPPTPITPPFTCIYWRNNPTLIWALIGWWGTVGNAFGLRAGAPGLGANMNLLQALSNTRADGLGELYREGTAAWLNSMAHARFPYTATQVRDSFIAALSSNNAARAQAQLFKLANEGRIQPKA